MVDYIGIGNETCCPNCGTQIEYDSSLWVIDKGVYGISGQCPNNECLAYKPASKGIPHRTEVRFITWRFATEKEKKHIENRRNSIMPAVETGI